MYLESYLKTQQAGPKHSWHTQTVSAVSIAEALRQLESRLQNAHATGSADQLCTAFLKAAALPEYLMANRDQNQKQFDQVYQTAGELLQELIQLAENLEGKRS